MIEIEDLSRFKGKPSLYVTIAVGNSIDVGKAEEISLSRAMFYEFNSLIIKKYTAYIFWWFLLQLSGQRFVQLYQLYPLVDGNIDYIKNQKTHYFI